MGKLLIGAAAVFAIAASPAAAAPPDTTTGTGTRMLSIMDQTILSQTVHVNAQSDEGLNPRGHFLIDQDMPASPASTFKVHGDVTCHRVLGNWAVVGGRLEQPVLGFQGVVIAINDDGEPGAGQDDLVFVFTPTPPSACPPPTEDETPIEKGNYTVHDR